MTITPNQVAPCYIKTTGSTSWELLKLGCTVPINIGDICCLLPDKSWIKIVETMAAEQSDEQPPEKKVCLESSTEAILSPSKDLNDALSSNTIDSVKKDLQINNNNGIQKRPMTESIMKDIYGASTPEEGELKGTESLLGTTKDTVSSLQSDNSTKAETKEDSPKIINKENICNEDCGKKIKWDCGQHFSDQTSSDAIQTTVQPSVSSPKPDTVNLNSSNSPPPRNKCTYGSRCYRRNSDHRTMFSHPGDADYDVPDNRPECRFGIRCYRKNPQHRKEFKHTVRSRGRAPTPIRAKTPDTSGTDPSSAEESIDESEYDPSCCSESAEDIDSEWEDK
ncbi:aprataxin and PNK-like factor isoform X2 [Orussus abietinus]|uniref:aprataxin and PNK-like factor isoform X2 n=1 Tax=Orussus abietinus TaxID=222816 RepID=UPI000625D9AD|nr:aprataxin and PNK-like factor isoform X2 [Orussus abietinus]